VRLVFAGTPAVAVPSLDALLASRHEVVAVLTRPDAPSGRGRRLTASPVAERAAEAGIPVLRPQRVRDPAFLDELRAMAPECCPVVAYGALVPPDALAVPVHGWVNLHFSLLPAWRGAAPVQHAVIAGDEFTGASTFRLEEGLDTGPVFGVVTERVRADDTSGSLLERLAGAGAPLLVSTLDAIEAGVAEPVPQPADG
jgi:methionyl-tRNA formyltransferase